MLALRPFAAGRFEVVARTSAALAAREQGMHAEVDLPRPLRLARGHVLGLAREDRQPLDVDSKLYASPLVLYGDVAGPMGGASRVAHVLGELDDTQTSYPQVRYAAPLRDAFLSSASPPPPGAQSSVGLTLPSRARCGIAWRLRRRTRQGLASAH